MARARWVQGAGRVGTMALVAVCATLLASIASIGARAAPLPSGPSISVMEPASSSGPVGTLVTLEVDARPTSPTAYDLTVATTAPDQGGCASAQALRGVPAFVVDPQQGAQVAFHWPAGLSRGTYWFCASPTNGNGPMVTSGATQSFKVLTDVAPTVRIAPPTGGLKAGSALALTVANWITSDGGAPSQIGVLMRGGADSSIVDVDTQSTGAADTAAGTYALTATVPTDEPAGWYTVVARGECDQGALGKGSVTCAVTERSAFFTVLAAPAPTAAPVTPTPQGSLVGHGGAFGTGIDWFWVIAGAAVLLVILAGLSIYMTTRAHARAARQRANRRDRRDRRGSPDRANDRYRRDTSDGYPDRFEGGYPQDRAGPYSRRDPNPGTRSSVSGQRAGRQGAPRR